MSEHQEKLSKSHLSGYYAFNVALVGSELRLVHDDGCEFAQLNRMIEEASDEISELQLFHCEAFVDTNRCLNILQNSQRPADRQLTADINIYASRHNVEEVGRWLSTKRLYLQPTDYRTTEFEYSNPHMLLLPGFQDKSLATFQQNSTQESRAARDFGATMTEIWSSLSRVKSLRGLKADSQIQSVLFE